MYGGRVDPSTAGGGGGQSSYGYREGDQVRQSDPAGRSYARVVGGQNHEHDPHNESHSGTKPGLDVGKIVAARNCLEL